MTSGKESNVAKRKETTSGFLLKPVAIAGGLLILTAISSLAYVTGIMSGRSYAHKEKLEYMVAEKKQTTHTSEHILAPEELEFARILRNEATTQKTTTSVQGTETQPPQKPVNNKTSGQPSIFDYTFQVSALADEDSADALRQRLEGRELRTRMKHSGKLYIVLVLLRGNAARAGEVIKMLEDMHLGRPILLERTPVIS